nr:pentatricopeptide repeat-containing protein At2g01390 [Ipomoea batatas]
MFSSHGALRFTKKLRSFLGIPASSATSGSRKIISNYLHCLRESKGRRPNRLVNRHVNKSWKKLVKKHAENVETSNVYMRDLVTKISNILRYSTWDSAQVQLENLAVKWDSYTVNQVLKTHPPMEKAWLFFNWAARVRGFKHDQYTYTTMLDIFGEARRISSMMFVFKRMQEKGVEIDVVTYTSLLHWLSNDGDVEGAVRLWHEMRAKGCCPTVVSYTAYMKVLFDHNRVSEGAEVYKEMLESGCYPNCHTYTVLMEHLAHIGKFDKVEEIFCKMQEAGVKPDKATCNILIEKCCKANGTRTMMKILDYMKENFLVLRYSVYKEALETLNSLGESDVLLKQVNRHFSSDYCNEVQTYRSGSTVMDNQFNLEEKLVIYLLNKQNLIAIDYLIADLMGKCMRLDSGIISSVVEANCNCGRQGGALLAFDFSKKLGISVERTAYLTLIGELVRTNSYQRVVEIVEAMLGAGLTPGSQLSALLIHRLGCSNDPVSAEKVFCLLPYEEKGTVVYTGLIRAYFLSANADKGLELFEKMKRQGMNVSLGTYYVLLNGLERNGRVGELECYRKEKKILEAEYHKKELTMEERLCDILFSGFGL